MIKNIRNNLLTKNLEINYGNHKKAEEREIASWDYVTLAYEIDHLGRDKPHLSHITNQHIYPKQIRRMSVKHAAQVLGDRFGNEIESQAENEGM